LDNDKDLRAQLEYDVAHERAKCLDNLVGRLTDATLPALDLRVYVGNTNFWSRSALESPLGKTIATFCRVRIGKKWRDENLGLEGAGLLVEPFSRKRGEVCGIMLGYTLVSGFGRARSTKLSSRTEYPVLDFTEFTTTLNSERDDQRPRTGRGLAGYNYQRVRV
jgi:hypothetical protein